MKNIVERIKKSLATAPEIAVLSGVPPSTLHNWLRGKSEPKDKHVELVDIALTEITGFTREQIKALARERKAQSGTIGMHADKDLQEALRFAAGNKHLKIQGIEELNKLRANKDVNVGTSNLKDGKLHTPHTQTNEEDEIMPKEFMNALSECLAIIKEQAITIKEQNRKIPDAPEGERTLKKRAG